MIFHVVLKIFTQQKAKKLTKHKREILSEMWTQSCIEAHYSSKFTFTNIGCAQLPGGQAKLAV